MELFFTNSKRLLYFKYMVIESQTVMNCEACGVRCQKFGAHRNGLRRFRCLPCKRTYTEQHERMLGGYLADKKVTLALQLLLGQFDPQHRSHHRDRPKYDHEFVDSRR